MTNASAVADLIIAAAKSVQAESAANWKTDAEYAEAHEEFRTCTLAAEKIARIGIVRKAARRVFACGDPLYAAAILDRAAAQFDLGEDAMIATVANGAVLTW